MYKRQPNRIIENSKKGKPSFGMQMYMPELRIYEAIGWEGFDFVMIDMEHSRINYETLENIIRVCEMTGVTPLVRVPQTETKYIRFALEAGARGVVCPHVKSAEDVRRAQAALHFPPYGHPGVCPAVRSNRYAQDNWADYMRDTNENTMLIALFEDVEAVENVDSIIAELKPGRDGFGLGLADIAHALMKDAEEGVNWRHPFCKETKETVIPKAKERGLIQLSMAYDTSVEAIKACAEVDKCDAIMFYPDIALVQMMIGNIMKNGREYRGY